MYANSAELAKLVDRARAIGIAGLDTEFIRERTYYPRLALVQLVVEETCVLIDPLDNTDLSPLEELMSDEETLKVVHAGDQDLEIFYHRFRRAPRSIFDTQIAGAMIGLGAQLSLANLCDALLGVRLEKGESFTNWLTRPLTKAQEHYALEDVRHLLPLHRALLARIDEYGRSRWLREELERFESPQTLDPDPRQAFWSVRKASHLDRRSLAVLRELAAWRELTARSRDVPKRKVMSDESLVEIARRRPTSPGGLRHIRGLHPHEASRSARSIAKAIQIGMALPDKDCPKPKKRARLSSDQALVSSIAQAFLQIHCAQNHIDASLIATNADIDELISSFVKGEARSSEIPLMNGWRRDLCGEALIELFEGKAKLKISQDPFRGVIARGD